MLIQICFVISIKPTQIHINAFSNDNIPSALTNTVNSNLTTDHQYQKTSSVNFTPSITNGLGRNGSTYKTAIDLKENEILNGSVNENLTSFYYRYYSQFPYEYVNITVNANDSNFHFQLLDQFMNPITSSTYDSSNVKSLIISSDNSTYKLAVRFIGWYYINVSTPFNPISFQIQFYYIKGDGSSLWSPIQIQVSPNAWNGIFPDKENSGFRDSTFYSFYVNLSMPLIDFTAINASTILLYGPHMEFLKDFFYSGEWLATEQGYYYFEVMAYPGTTGRISLDLQKTNLQLGYSINQPLEISRSSTLVRNLTVNWLKLYLYVGENVSLNIGNSFGTNYSVSVYGSWQKGYSSNPMMFNVETSLQGSSINLFNVECTGYYVLSVNGPTGYSVKLSFLYNLHEGMSWESAKHVNVDHQFTDQHYLFTNNSYFYRVEFESGSSLNISLKSDSIKDVYILGKYREIIGYIDLSTSTGFVVLNNLTKTNFIFIQITPSTNYSKFRLSIVKLPQLYSHSLSVDGTLLLYNSKSNHNETIPLIELHLLERIGSTEHLLAITSTDQSGYFSFMYTKNLDLLNKSLSFFIEIIFTGPALQLWKYSSSGQNQVSGAVYTVNIDLNTSFSPDIHLSEFLIPYGSWSYELAHIFRSITLGWLWIDNLDITARAPQQIHVLYSADSPGTYYSPYAVINNEYTKYVINLLGINYSSTHDDDGWDDTVILHEYGHHVEMTYDIQNSPGGPHYYYTTVSPGFAHAEGFPTFFASVVLNSSIYRDTQGNSFDGINLETGRKSSSDSSNNTLEDLFGPYGETSVLALYYDLLDAHNGDDIDNDGIGDSITLPVDNLFNVFFNYRTINGLGVTNTDSVYQALIQSNPSLIDNISKTYYDHGNGYYAYPFIQDNGNKIVSSTDVTANFTWKLYDSNPKSYQILVDSKLVKTGVWNFTEEVLVLNIHQFGFKNGTTHNFLLKLNDTLDHERIYFFTVKIISSYNLLGKNFPDSINIVPNIPVSVHQNVTTYFEYNTTQNELVNISYLGKSYNLSIYENGTLIRSFDNAQQFKFFYLLINKSQIIYLVFNYISGNETLTLELDNNPLGYSKLHPLIVSNTTFQSFRLSSNYSKYYVEVTTSYASRVLTVSMDPNPELLLSIYFINGTLVKNVSIGNLIPNFSYNLPLNLMVPENKPFNPFSTFLLVFSTNSSSFKADLTLKSLKLPSIVYTGPTIFLKNENQSLTFSYTGVNTFTFHLFINNKLFIQNSYESLKSSVFSFSILVNSLSSGFYVGDLEVLDANGLSFYYQFNFTITSLQSSTAISLTTSRVTSKNNLISDFGLLGALAIVASIGAIAIYYERTHRRKISQFLKKIANKKRRSE